MSAASPDLKIVFLSPAAQQGGAEAVLLDILKLFSSERPAWTLHLIAGEEGPLLSKASLAGVSCELLPFPETVRALGENRRPNTILNTKEGQHQPRTTKWLAPWLRTVLAAMIYHWKLRRRLQHLRPDLVHSNGM